MATGLHWGMMEARKTEVYVKWLDGLRCIRARARVLARVELLGRELVKLHAEAVQTPGLVPDFG